MYGKMAWRRFNSAGECFQTLWPAIIRMLIQAGNFMSSPNKV